MHCSEKCKGSRNLHLIVDRCTLSAPFFQTCCEYAPPVFQGQGCR